MTRRPGDVWGRFDGWDEYVDDEGNPVAGCPGVAIPGVDPACECSDCPYGSGG